MKRYILIFFCLISSISYAKEFSSSINRVNSSGFPSIRAIVKIYNTKSEILKSANFELTEDSIKISTYSVDIMKNKQYIILLLDQSSSIKSAMKIVKSAATTFALKMLKTVSICVMSIASDVEFEQNFTSDAQKIIKATHKIRP